MHFFSHQQKLKIPSIIFTIIDSSSERLFVGGKYNHTLLSLISRMALLLGRKMLFHMYFFRFSNLLNFNM